MAVTLGHLDVAGLVLVLLLGAALAWAAGVMACRETLRRPARRTYASAVSRSQPGTPAELDAARWGTAPRPFTCWSMRRPDGSELPVWEVRGDSPDGPVVVMTHGWGDSKVGALVRIEPFIKCASTVLMWDLPGHGEASRNAGPCQLGRSEVEDLLELVSRTTGPVVLFGWSLGGGVGIVAATRCERVIGVVCEAPYRLPATPASRVMAAMGMPGLGLVPVALWTIGGVAWQRAGGGFDRAAHAAKLCVPLLVVHGDADPVCPIEDGQGIAAGAERGECVPVAGGRHNDLWINPVLRTQVLTAVSSWLALLRGVDRKT